MTASAGMLVIPSAEARHCDGTRDHDDLRAGDPSRRTGRAGKPGNVRHAAGQSRGRIALVFDGEISSFRELAAELRQAGEPLRTRSDDEVLLELYRRGGPSSVAKLRGTLAFAIWDAPRRRLLLGGDRLGKKPLLAPGIIAVFEDGPSDRSAPACAGFLANPGAVRRARVSHSRR